MARDGIEPSTFRFSVGFGPVSVLQCASVRKAISSQGSIHVPLWIMMLRYVCDKIVIRLALFHKSYQGLPHHKWTAFPDLSEWCCHL